MSGESHAGLMPSPWITRWSHLVAPGARVTGIDRDVAAIEPLQDIAEVIVADLEGAPWPLPGRRFDAVVCTNYLWRPLLPLLRDSVASGGLLVYETFAVGHETVGRPSNPDFLLRPGELLAAFAGLRIVAYEDGFIDTPPRFVQRAVAANPASGMSPPRWPLA